METDARKLSEAKIVYKTLCSTLDNKKWKYTKEEDKLIVRTGAVGDDLSMKLYVKVDAERGVMYLKSPMPFTVSADRINDITVATTIANWAILNGCFELDRQDGYCGFKMVVPFMDSIISERVCKYLIDLSCNMVDKYNDKLLSVANGTMTIDEFEKFAQQ